VEAFFEGESLSPAGAVNSYNNKKIVLRETSSATHSFKHNEADAGAINVADAGSLTSGANIMLQKSVHLILTMQQPQQLQAAKDLNTGAVWIRSNFQANVTTLAGTGRVKPVTSAGGKCYKTLLVGKTYKVVAFKGHYYTWWC
jgi:hypothetical protein